MLKRDRKHRPVDVNRVLFAFEAKVKKLPLANVELPKGDLINITDKDNDSNLYFCVSSYKIEGGVISFHILYIPSSSSCMDEYDGWVTSLDNAFDPWYKLIEEYENLDKFSDDSDTNSCAGEYYTQFEIIDEDADKPLPDDKMRFLDENLKSIEDNIEQYIDGDNEAEILEIKADATNIRKNITKKSRADIWRMVAVMCGKIKKLGPPFFEIFGTEVVKTLAKNTTEAVINLISN